MALLSAVVATALMALPSRAQSGRDAAIARIIEQARAAGVDVVVIDAPEPVAPPAPASLSEQAMQFADRVSANLLQTLVDLSAARESLPAAVAAIAPDGSVGWLWWTLAVTVLAAIAGWGVERALYPAFVGSGPAPLPAGAARTRRIRAMGVRAAIDLVLIAIGLFVALLLTVSFSGNGPHHRTVTLAVFEAVVVVRVLLIFARMILVPETQAGSILPVPPAAATRAYTMLRTGLWSAALLFAPALFLSRVGAAPGLVTAAGIGVSLALALTFARTAVFLDRQIRAGRSDGMTGAGWLTRNWHRIVLAYLVLAVTATALGRLSGLETSGMVIAPVAGAILASIVYAAALLAVGAVVGEGEGAAEPPLPSFRTWAERSSLLVAVVVALCAVFGTWGIEFFRADGSVRAVYAIMLVLLLAYIGWLAIRTAFDRRIAAEQAGAGPQLEDGDEGGTGGTRLATLLPLFRNAILIAILVLVLLVMLSSMGLDIAPLFAGAGLVGIAIGFGAQTLVRDIFSGIFFLADDAFRVGEYIEIGGARGTVEKISIRSMQLRHQNGPLHTIPFGEITQLTNYSRDWVIMKLPIRVRFGTDTERVRKLIKKLGQELLAHPVIGEKFVDPLKFQGVYQMDELGIVTRVKFKTRPGDQFTVRKVVYQKINELFEREGIAFGGREVIVRSAEPPQPGVAPLSSTDAAGAAALAAESHKPRST